MSKWDEQHQADLLRALYRMGLLDIDELCSIVDELQVRLFKAEHEDKNSRTRQRYDGN